MNQVLNIVSVQSLNTNECTIQIITFSVSFGMYLCKWQNSFPFNFCKKTLSSYFVTFNFSTDPLLSLIILPEIMSKKLPAKIKRLLYFIFNKCYRLK